MRVKMIRNTRAPGFPEVESNVVTLRTQCLVKPIEAGRYRARQLDALIVRQILISGYLPVRRDQQVPVVVRKQIHEYKNAFPSPNYEMLLVVVGFADCLEKTRQIFGRAMLIHEAFHVLGTPGTPYMTLSLAHC